MKKKKGFTMVEILAAVTILGIISVVAIIAVNNIIQKAKSNHYETAEKELELAGQTYAQQNRSELPKAIGQKKKIPLKTLIDKNYIETIKDYSGNNCDVDESYVQVFKYSQSDYSYLPYLKCDRYDGQKSFEDGAPNISLTITDGNRLKKAEANIKITDEEKLLSWSYIVYKDGKEVLNSGNMLATNYPKTITKTLDVSKHTPGLVKVVVTATNIYGQTTTKAIQRNYNDIEKPTCVYLNSSDNPENGVTKFWTTDARTITVGCDDKDGIGCSREEYTKTFKDSTNIGYITIKDKKGNTTDCPVVVMIDKKSPTITINAYKQKSNGTKDGAAFATKTLTGKQESPLTTTFDLSKETPTGWYNNTSYPYGVYLEVEVSDDVEISTYKTTINNPHQKTSTTEDKNLVNEVESKTKVGKTTETFKISVSEEGYRTLAVRVTDIAGNISRVNIILPIDRTSPSTPNVGLYKWVSNTTEPSSESGLDTYQSNTWTNKNIYTKASNSTDSLSGFDKYIYTTSGETENVTNKSGQSRNIKAEGESKIKYAACDVAGNCSGFSTEYTIKIDKTLPTCVSSGGKTSWTNQNITLRGQCSDLISGCTDAIKVYSSNTNSTTESPGWVTDNAGNKSECPSNQTVKIDKNDPSPPTIGTISINGSSTAGTILAVSGATDTGGSGLKEYKYFVANSQGTYTNEDTRFTSTKTFTRSCGTSYYLYAYAIDHAGNKSSVVNLTSAADGVDSYSNWTSCSKQCDGGTQTRTNTCALITSDLSRKCNERACCSSSSITYVETTTCSKKCGGGTYLRRAYSSYDTSVACPSYNDYNGGRCNTGDCCASTTTSWGKWSACSKDCGGGTRKRTGTKYSDIDGSNCGSDEETEACNTGACVNYCSDASFSCSSSWQNAGASWGKWCRASGGPCNASGGYTRICSSSWCSGMTAKEVNNKYGCSYATLCCKCK